MPNDKATLETVTRRFSRGCSALITAAVTGQIDVRDEVCAI